MKQDIPPEIENLINEIERNQLTLPTMPDWAMKVQKMLDDINVSASQIVSALSRDPVFVAQIINKANSAIYAGMPKVETVRDAVSRLGYRKLRSLIVKITMANLTHANHPVIRTHMTEFMMHSCDVAAVSYVLAKNIRHLNAEEAMLAGLVHDIGMLPICIYADQHISKFDAQICDQVVRRYSGLVGEKLLNQWAFPAKIARIPMTHQDFRFSSNSVAVEYDDVVTVANLICQPGSKFVAWEKVVSASKLGMVPEICREFNESQAENIRAAHQFLFED